MSARSALLALGLLAAAVLSLQLLSSSDVVEAGADRTTLVAVERGSFEVRVQFVGELQPVRATTLSSGIRSDRGKIIEIIDDGAEVETGDVLVRFDRTPFEEEERHIELEVALAESVVDARRQAFEWEKAQAERRIQTAKFDLEVAALDKHRLEKGEGPLELARLESELFEREGEWKDQSGFLGELEGLRARGHVTDAEIEQVTQRSEKARRTADLAVRQFETYRDFILPTRKATLKHKVEQADMEYQQTQVSAGFKIGESQAALQQAERDLDAARGRLEKVRAELERTVLRAPQPGMVVLRAEFREQERRKPRVGDSVWQNQPLLYLPDLSQMEVVGQVREVDVHLVEPGNEGMARLDAYPELALPARVRSIGVLAEREEGVTGGEKSFRVLVDLEEGDARLRPGMTARVDILSARVEDALVVPIQSVWESDGERWCWVLPSAGAAWERRSVAVGAVSRHLAAITGGLREGEHVSLVEPAAADDAGR